MAGNQERTFIMVKPDGVQRGLVGEIIKRFETKGFKLVALKLVWVSFNLIKKKKFLFDQSITLTKMATCLFATAFLFSNLN